MSIAISFHGLSGGVMGTSGALVDPIAFRFSEPAHWRTYALISLFMLGQKYLLRILDSVFFTPKWPAKGYCDIEIISFIEGYLGRGLSRCRLPSVHYPTLEIIRLPNRNIVGLTGISMVF